MTLKNTALDVKNLTNTVENNIQNVSSLDDNIGKNKIENQFCKTAAL